VRCAYSVGIRLQLVEVNLVPDSPEYLSRIRDLVNAGDPLLAQAQSPDLLAQLLAGVSIDQLTTRPAPGKWSVAEILAHLAEDEIATAWRYRQMVEHSGITLPGFDQDLWAKLGNYPARQPEESLSLFRHLRNANLQFLGSLTAGQWDCFGIHTERGRITVRELAAHMAGHDANHIEQIRGILSRPPVAGPAA
jgi:hypothetical protein